MQRVVLATSYRAEVFRATYGDGARLGLDLSTRSSPNRWEPGEPSVSRLTTSRTAATRPSFLNGDILSAHDLDAQIRQHVDVGAAATLHTRNVDPTDVARFGTVLTHGRRITGFLEKHPEPITTRINAGCYVFTTRGTGTIPAGEVVSVERDTFPALISSGAPVIAYDEQAYWIDVGTLEAYKQADDDFSGDSIPA